jgi:hypothetical protein
MEPIRGQLILHGKDRISVCKEAQKRSESVVVLKHRKALTGGFMI